MSPALVFVFEGGRDNNQQSFRALPFHRLALLLLNDGEQSWTTQASSRGRLQDDQPRVSMPSFRVQEISRLRQDPVPDIEAIPDEQNQRHFKVIINGPPQVECSFCRHADQTNRYGHLESVRRRKIQGGIIRAG